MPSFALMTSLGGLLAAFAVSCSSGASIPNASAGASAGASAAASASAGTPASGAQSGGGASAGNASAGASGSNSAGAGGGASSASGSSGAGSNGGSDAGNLSDGSDAGNNPDGPDGVTAAQGCAGKTYKLCEDFESGTVGGVPTGWTTRRGYAAQRGGIGLASDQAHWGSKSLKSEGANTGQDRVERSLAGLGATITKHWGRIFYRVGAPLPKPTAGVIHITFAALEGTTENRVVDTVVATNGTHQWLFNIPDDSCCAGSSYNWTFDSSWHCAEWNIDVAAASFRFYSDSKEVTELAFAGKTNAKMSAYTSIALGTIFYQTPPSPVVVWFDDLAIDDNQIGCQ